MINPKKNTKNQNGEEKEGRGIYIKKNIYSIFFFYNLSRKRSSSKTSSERPLRLRASLTMS